MQLIICTVHPIHEAYTADRATLVNTDGAITLRFNDTKTGRPHALNINAISSVNFNPTPSASASETAEGTPTIPA